MRGEHAAMNWQSKNTKKSFLLFLSLVFGGAIILGSAKIAGVFGTTVPSKTPDSSEWKSTLSVLPGSIALTRVAKGDIRIDEIAQSATTTTDLISRRLIIEYALSQKGTSTSTMSNEEAENIANILAKEVKLPQKKQYKLSDLNISADNSESAGILYKKTLNALVQSHTATEQTENELTVLVIAMGTKDSAYLNKLKVKTALYQELVKKLIALKTPSSVAPIHLHLLQGYETLRSATAGLQSMLDDPVLGIAALAEYKKGIDMLVHVEQEYKNFNPPN